MLCGPASPLRGQLGILYLHVPGKGGGDEMLWGPSSPGLEKTRFKKKTSPVGFLLLIFLGFLFFFWFFCPDERVFRVFSVSPILLGASRL
jgi:hypothetical protein